MLLNAFRRPRRLFSLPRTGKAKASSLDYILMIFVYGDHVSFTNTKLAQDRTVLDPLIFQKRHQHDQRNN